jgi:hypothetical protein
MILVLSRGHYCPKDHQQHLELAANYPKIAAAYTQVVTISTDNIIETREFRASVGASTWTPSLGGGHVSVLSGPNLNYVRASYRSWSHVTSTVRQSGTLREIGVAMGAMCPSRPNVIGALDFQFDQTADRRMLKLVNVIDEYSRECFAVDVDCPIDADGVVRWL